MTRQRHGCCVDRACTPHTCMELPEGTTCGSCVHLSRCLRLFGCKPDNTSCDWFPRRFAAAPPPETKFEARICTLCEDPYEADVGDGRTLCKRCEEETGCRR